MSKMEELFTLREFEIMHETGKALLIEVHGEEMWIPLSQVTDRDDKAGTLTVTAWIAKMKNLI